MVANGNDFQNIYFKLGANLDFTNISISPVGTESQPFMGIFDGNGYSSLIPPLTDEKKSRKREEINTTVQKIEI